jgi:hypothetical protein
MSDLTRRRFIETAGLAAFAVPSLATAAQAAAATQTPTRASAQRVTTRAIHRRAEAMFQLLERRSLGN